MLVFAQAVLGSQLAMVDILGAGLVDVQERYSRRNAQASRGSRSLAAPVPRHASANSTGSAETCSTAATRGTAMVSRSQAVATGEVEVITALSSDGRIAANDLVVLEDPRGVILPYDAVVLIAAEQANDALLHRAPAPLVGAIPVEVMREANHRVDRGRDAEPPVPAARWLALQVLER